MIAKEPSLCNQKKNRPFAGWGILCLKKNREKVGLMKIHCA